MMKILAPALTILFLLIRPLCAGESPPVYVDVLPGWQLADGRRVAALHLTLERGWKTYWRAPGETGIPPRFYWHKGANIKEMQITWPKPEVFYDEGMRSIGYKERVIIPLHISPQQKNKAIHLKGKMEIGLCKDVCVPFTLNFDRPLEQNVKRSPTPMIAAAMASAPFSASEAGVRNVTCRLTPLQNGMQLEARITMPPAGTREDVVIEAGRDDIWVSEPESRRKGDHIIAVSQLHHASNSGFAINRSALRITVLGSDYAVDIRGCQGG